MKKLIALTAGALLAGAAASASAQYYVERTYTYDPYYGARAGDECWNPRAGHFEEVRPGEVQNDLDFSRCRPIGAYNNGYVERRVYRDWRYGERAQECWNPRAGHYEAVRPGEYQGDLDFSRCRFYRY
jgi:hypothetical protein